MEIARKLDELGIHQIESGFPVVSKQEKISVKAIADEGLNAEILALCRTKKRISTLPLTAALMAS